MLAQLQYRAGAVLTLLHMHVGGTRAAHYGLPAPQLQQPHTAQPGTPPATSGHASDQAGGASPASSEGSGMPLKKRSRPSA